MLNSYISSSAPLISLCDHTTVITNASYSMLVSETAIPALCFQSFLVILVHFVALVLLLSGVPRHLRVFVMNANSLSSVMFSDYWKAVPENY